ncbi:MAG: hypothetical protein BWY52_00080 [Chloroflexi bacterium ADurb.Bin325]|nr:MAG: hypothetical protein BWY52_00080 [Chloroflexi bacterium ADurb.Bin325]
MANETISKLIEDLGGSWRQRRDARDLLQAMGPAAVPELAAAAQAANDQVRWEALKILSERLDPALAPLFIDALVREQNEGNRWVASHALMNLGPAALRPLLESLVQRADSASLREGAHAILYTLAKQQALPTGSVDTLIKPVLVALERLDPAVHVPFAAHRALDAMAGRPLV